ncbi:MAG TPA: hypothetical protein VM658_07225 [bacterium]|nr:hypothetical protein [bacterium]
MAYFGETNTFGSGPDCFAHIAWSPEGRNQYSYYCGDDEIRCVKCEKDCSYPNLSVIGPNSFTVMAVGNIDDDDDCDVWTINDAKNLRNVEVDP